MEAVKGLGVVSETNQAPLEKGGVLVVTRRKPNQPMIPLTRAGPNSVTMGWPTLVILYDLKSMIWFWLIVYNHSNSPGHNHLFLYRWVDVTVCLHWPILFIKTANPWKKCKINSLWKTSRNNLHKVRKSNKSHILSASSQYSKRWTVPIAGRIHRDSHCRKSLLRKSNVALSNLRNGHVTLSNLRNYHVPCHYLLKTNVACH